jgi:hypothetical protein
MNDQPEAGKGRDAGERQETPDQKAETIFSGQAFAPPPAPQGAPAPVRRYALGAPIGEGGMAVVYEARDTELDRPVALKTLRTEHAGNEGHRGRFDAEVRIMAALDHPGAVPVYEAGVLPGGEPAVGDDAVEGLSVDELHGEEVDAARFLDRVDGDDAGMVERGEGLRLALEAREPIVPRLRSSLDVARDDREPVERSGRP